MSFAQTLAAIVLSLNPFTAAAQDVDVAASQPAEPAAQERADLQSASAAGYHVVWYDWVDCYGFWNRTYSEYDFYGRLIRRWTVRL